MSRPWMPFYVADYLADTGHLRTVEHGAYLLLIMHYWRTGALPPEDAKLAKITRLPFKAWTESVRPAVEPLFTEGWRHKRIDFELGKQDAILTKRAVAGKRGGDASAIARMRRGSVRLSKHAKREPIGEQMASNHNHKDNTSTEFVAAREGALEVSSGLEAIVRSKGW